MALSEAARGSLAGLWGSYDFYLIRDKHTTTSSSRLVERFLKRYRPLWRKSSRPNDREFAHHSEEVLELLTQWAEKKLGTVAKNDSAQTLHANIMFKQLLFDDETLNFGSIETNWKPKVEIAAELQQYKPWSVAHAAAAFRGKERLQKQMHSIIESAGSTSELGFFEAWWKLTEEERPMLFPQTWGHTSGKLYATYGEERTFPAKFSFGLVNVVTRSKVLVQRVPKSASTRAADKRLLEQKRDVSSSNGWTLFEFSSVQLRNELDECFDALADFLTY